MELSSRSVVEIVKVLNSIKNYAFIEGCKNKVLLPREIPEGFKGGHFAEIASMAMLGRLSISYKDLYSIDLQVKTSFENDLKKCDISLYEKEINIKSRFTTQTSDYHREGPDDVVVIYDRPGFYNMLKILQSINCIHYVPDHVVRDINYLWELYMSFSTLKTTRCGITYKNLIGNDLNKFSVFVKELPLQEFRKLKEEQQMFKNIRNSKPTTSHHQDKDKQVNNTNTSRKEYKYWQSPDNLKNEIQKIFDINKINKRNVISNIKTSLFNAQIRNNVGTNTDIILFMYPELKNVMKYVDFYKGFGCKLINYIDEVKKDFPTKEKISTSITISWIESRFFKGVLNLKQFNNSLFNFVQTVYPDVKKWEIENINSSEFTDVDIDDMTNILIDTMGLNLIIINFINENMLKSTLIGKQLFRTKSFDQLKSNIEKKLKLK